MKWLIVFILIFSYFKCESVKIKYFEKIVKYKLSKDYHLKKLIKAIKNREGFKNKFYIQDKKKTIGYGFQYKNSKIKENQPVTYYDSILLVYINSFSKPYLKSKYTESFKYKMIFLTYVSGKVYESNKIKGYEKFKKFNLERYY